MKTTTELLKITFNNDVYKFGGASLGNVNNMDILRVLFHFFELIGGRPAGVVVSAPKGLTRQLHDMFELSSDGIVSRSIGEFYFITTSFMDAWRRMRNELRNSLNPEQIDDYEAYIHRIEKEINNAFFKFKREFAEALTSDFGNKNQDFAVIGSLGERMMGAILKPFCELLTKFFGMNFVYIDPQKYLVAERGSVGHSELSPDVMQSVINLHSLVKKKKQEFSSSDITFIMPGFCLGVRKGTEIGIMEYNGSDTSAYILAKALLCEAIYVKKVVGELSDIRTLRQVQQEKNTDIMMGSSLKQDELVADRVLELLLDGEDDLHIFDIATKERIVLPCVATKKSLVITRE